MTWALAGIAYGVVALVAAGIAARRFAWNEVSRYGRRMFHTEDIVLAMAGGLLAGVVWPLALPFGVAVWVLRRDVDKNHPSVIAEREKEALKQAREAEARVRELERELGIGERY